MAVIYLQILIELSMPKLVTAEFVQFNVQGVAILQNTVLVSKGYRRVQGHINYIYIVFSCFLILLSILNTGFICFIVDLVPYCGYLAIGYVYGVPASIDVGVINELEV
jgi:hypothetical protein